MEINEQHLHFTLNQLANLTNSGYSFKPKDARNEEEKNDRMTKQRQEKRQTQ